jgi:N-acetylneuraminic acid mutarotase
MNGKVLVSGGFDGSNILNTTELYDPSTGVWTMTGSMNNDRVAHTASVLTNGKVLVTGGVNSNYFDYSLNTTELYDPSTGMWTLTGSMNYARYYHTASVLMNGKVLVTGGNFGNYSNSSELYDPSTGMWTLTGGMNIDRAEHTASVLMDGKVLVTGGLYDGNYMLNSAELYDPSTGTWTLTGGMNIDRIEHTASVLTNGQILVTGGYGINGNLNSAELYQP